MNELGYFKVWKAKLPRGLKVQDMNDKLDRDHRGWWTHIIACLTLHKEIVVDKHVYKNTSLIMTAMGKYYIHPGTKRYLLESICHEFPQSDVLILNRWGTTDNQIKSTFPDAKRHRAHFDGWFNYKDMPHKNVTAHGLKTDREGGKDWWLHNAKAQTTRYQYGQDHYTHPLVEDRCVEYWYKGQRKIIVGTGQRQVVEIIDVEHLTRHLLETWTNARL